MTPGHRNRTRDLWLGFDSRVQTPGPEQPNKGWVEPQRESGQLQTRDKRLVRAETNKLGTGSGYLFPSLMGWKCEG
ncbi:unnamed protein product, partial [Timema podura]|nr:unnamed protein product [Timema podura]